jgi:hypothetical protein
MKRFFKGQSKLNSTFNSNKASGTTPARRNNATVEGIRKKLADYQKTEGPARFIQPQGLNYLQNGAIEFDAPAMRDDMTMGVSVPFTMA